MAIEVGPALGLSADSSDLKTAIPVLDALAKKAVQAEAAADKLAGGTKRMGSAMAAALASLKSIDGSLIKMASSQNKANQETDEAARKAQSAAAGYGSLRASLDPLYAASKRYEAALQTLDAATEAGVISDRDRLNTLRMLDAQFAATNTGAVKMAGGVGAAGNVFAQFNDIGMQAFSGQSPLLLAIQQGTQLNQVWGQLGNNTKNIGAAISGAFTQMLNPLGLLTLGIIAGGAALVQWGMSALGAGSDAKSFKDNVSAAETAIVAINDATASLADGGLEDLRAKYGQVNSEVRALVEQQQLLAIADGTKAINDALGGLTERLGEGILTSAYGDIERIFGVTSNSAQILFGVLEDIKTQDSLGAQLASITAIKDRLSSATDGFTNMNLKQAEMLRSLTTAESVIRQQQKALADVAAQTSVAAQKALDFNGMMQRVKVSAGEVLTGLKSIVSTQPSGGWLSFAIGQAGTLRDKLWGAFGALKSIGSAGPGMDTGNANWSKSNLGFTLHGDELLGMPTAVTGSGGVGGGTGGASGGLSDRQSGLDSLISELRTEQETLDVWRAENLAKIAEYSDAELAAIGGRNEAKLRLETEYQEKLKGIVDAEKNYRLTETGNMFDALASVAAAGGKKALRAQAVLSAASALISGYEAAMKAAAEAKTIPGRIAAYAQFVGMGLKAAATIRSAGGAGGGGGGGGGGGSSATAPATSAAPARPQEVILDYSATADPAMRALAAALLGPMIDQLQKASKTGINIVAVRA